MIDQRWEIAPSYKEEVTRLSQATGFSPLVAQIFINRGFLSVEAANLFIHPENMVLPPPETEFKDLDIAISLLTEAIAHQDKIAICGDYDADGMTSTALLIRALRSLGADVDYAIPDRHKDGYGINERIVKKMAEEGVGLIITVDNGISATGAIEVARDLGLDVIVTDHHDLPEKLPDANAILNPKLLEENSIYSGLAGVGVAYILALNLVENIKPENIDIENFKNQLLELFTLGTIADLAPLVGINRYLLKKGLRRLPNSEIIGIQALMQIGGVSEEQIKLQSDDIGFKLGPRINAVGRIGNPQIVIELLTTEDKGVALERAMQCEQANTKRQELCKEIEEQAIAIIEGKEESNLVPKYFLDWKKERVLVIGNKGWHHGVIGIVASRLVERYGVPTFICTTEDDDKIRGSARGIKEYNIFDALNFCQESLGKYGGHKMAGGFSLNTENLAAFQKGLKEFSYNCLTEDLLKPLVEIDVTAKLSNITLNLYEEIDSLYPWGIENKEPIFLSENVKIKEQRIIGKNHVKFTLEQDNTEIKGIAWRWGEYVPFPSCVNIAYKLKENTFNDVTTVELEIVGLKIPKISLENLPENNSKIITENKLTETNNNNHNNSVKKAHFTYNNRHYYCSLWPSLNELRIKNDQGKVLAVKKGERVGLLGFNRENSTQVNVTKNPYFTLIKTALKALDN